MAALHVLIPRASCRGNADGDAGNAFQSLGARFQSSACSQHIVDEKHMLSGKLVGKAHLKDVLHIIETFISRFMGLCIRVNSTDKVFVDNGDARRFMDAEGYHEALVVAALLLALGMQGDGNDIVDALKERLVFDALSDLFAEKHSSVFVAFVFQLVDKVLHFARLGEEKARGGGMQANTAIERLHDGVVGVVLIARARQGVAAFQADGVLLFEQRLATGSADAWIKEVDDAVEPVAE